MRFPIRDEEKEQCVRHKPRLNIRRKFERITQTATSRIVEVIDTIAEIARGINA